MTLSDSQGNDLMEGCRTSQQKRWKAPDSRRICLSLPLPPSEGELPSSALIFPGLFKDSNYGFLDWRSLTSNFSQVSDTSASDSKNSDEGKSQQCNVLCEGACTTSGSNAGSPPNAG